jgi:hypothetical protein
VREEEEGKRWGFQVVAGGDGCEISRSEGFFLLSFFLSPCIFWMVIVGFVVERIG